MADGATEGVARAKPVHHVHPYRLDPGRLVAPCHDDAPLAQRFR